MPVQFKSNTLEIANLGERHIPIVLIVDASGSMSGAPIMELNEGLRMFGDALLQDTLARGRADICILSCSSDVKVEMGFRSVSDYQAPTISASGLSSINTAIMKGLDVLEERKREYRENGVSYYRPWLFLLTDGLPTDEHLERNTKERLKTAIENKKVVFIPMAVGVDADIHKLQEYYPDAAESKPVLKVNAQDFRDAFVWVSRSVSAVSKSDPAVTSEIALPTPPESIVIGI